MTISPFDRHPFSTPTGGILIWTGPISNIPEGWLLCDGNNGTPDLTNRFIKSVQSAENPGTTGGQDSYTLSSSQMPTHSHSITDIDGAGSHSHDLDHEDYEIEEGNLDYGEHYKDDSTDIETTGNHSHGLNTVNTGGNSSIDSRPPYYEVVFIQRA